MGSSFKLVLILGNLKKKQMLMETIYQNRDEKSDFLTIFSSTNQHLMKVRKLDNYCLSNHGTL